MNVIGCWVDEYDDGIIANAILAQKIMGGLGNRQTPSAMNNGAVGLESPK